MAEFDPFAFLSWFVPLTISSIIALGGYVVKNAFFKGRNEAKTQGNAVLNQNLVTNAIKEIETIKNDLKSLASEIQIQKIDSTRLSERIKFMDEKLDTIKNDIRFMVRDNKEHVEKFDDWKREQR